MSLLRNNITYHDSIHHALQFYQTHLGLTRDDFDDYSLRLIGVLDSDDFYYRYDSYNRFDASSTALTFAYTAKLADFNTSQLTNNLEMHEMYQRLLDCILNRVEKVQTHIDFSEYFQNLTSKDDVDSEFLLALIERGVDAELLKRVYYAQQQVVSPFVDIYFICIVILLKLDASYLIKLLCLENARLIQDDDWKTDIHMRKLLQYLNEIQSKENTCLTS